MVVFMGSIVAYAYGGEKYKEYKENKAYQDRIRKAEEKEQALEEKYDARRQAREEKYKASRERSAFIKRELKRLELLKQGVVMEEE